MLCMASLYWAAIRTRPERADNVPPGTRTLPHRLTAKPTHPRPHTVLGGLRAAAARCSAALAVSLPILRVALALLVLIATEARLLVLILLRLVLRFVLRLVQVERLVHSMLCIAAGRDAV